MPYTVIVFETRKPDMPIEDFIKHYDNTHVPLVKECVGDAFPASHARYYLKRNSAARNGDISAIPPPLIFYGTPEEIDFDCVVIMVFDDFNAFVQFQEAYEKSPRKAEMDADEELFIIKSKLKAFATEDPHVTFR